MIAESVSERHFYVASTLKKYPLSWIYFHFLLRNWWTVFFNFPAPKTLDKYVIKQNFPL